MKEMKQWLKFNLILKYMYREELMAEVEGRDEWQVEIGYCFEGKCLSGLSSFSLFRLLSPLASAWKSLYICLTKKLSNEKCFSLSSVGRQHIEEEGQFH